MFQKQRWGLIRLIEVRILKSLEENQLFPGIRILLKKTWKFWVVEKQQKSHMHKFYIWRWAFQIWINFLEFDFWEATTTRNDFFSNKNKFSLKAQVSQFNHVDIQKFQKISNQGRRFGWRGSPLTSLPTSKKKFLAQCSL